MPKLNIDESIAKYEHYINDVLKADLQVLHKKLQQVNAEISDLIQQKHTLKVITDKKMHPDGFKTQVNLGCNFFMEAAVHETSTLLMNVGLNHYLEFSLDEAHKYLDVRIKAFEEKAEELQNKGAETKAHIKMMLFGIAELQNEKFKGKS
ncbi:protein UXT homolog [Plodia interpunctella]|uniref:protein UXT homolog n=1 Tax=Plodia interpunctella TaxID=58824 RepID=UPI0023678638|nr:protein UXT homolog [Plodia interpunctella]XP_053613484.1 protein UXT homolog [Plodia interpunctella]XP_053613485.1 protein UXT homolog [Plodia interpunctella]